MEQQINQKGMEEILKQYGQGYKSVQDPTFQQMQEEVKRIKWMN
jgi:hypothetical protein